MRSIKQILSEIPANLDSGLNSDGVAQSLVRFGPNRLTPIPREPLWKKFLEKFDEPIIKILLAAALLSIVVDLFKTSKLLGGFALAIVVAALAAAFGLAKLRRWAPSVMFGLAIFWVALGALTGHPSYEGLAVMIAVVLATGVAFLSEYKSDREFEALNARKDEILVKVTRNSAFTTVGLDEVVVGDLVTLEMGDEVPADGRILKATDLYLDQSLMTGESAPVKKSPRPQDQTADGPESPDCVYRGTQVADGVASMIVAEVGDDTMIGQIAKHLSADNGEEEEEEIEAAETEVKRVKKKLTISKEQTPLQVKLTNLAELISKVGYIAAALIFVAMLIFGIVKGKFAGDFFEAVKYLLDSFVYTVIVIVVAVPEGLPMSVTVSLALAMRKMTRANSLVRQLVACETIGSATVICSDKTGTLTQNKMRVDRTWWDSHSYERSNTNWPKPEARAPWPRKDSPLDWLALNAAVNSTANLEEKERKLMAVGNSTEGALLHWLHESGLVYQSLRLQFPDLHVLHFSSDRKRMTTAIMYGDRVGVLMKGAPEIVIGHTTHYIACDGSTRPLTDDFRRKLDDALKQAASSAMRTLAFAYRLMPPGTTTDPDQLHDINTELEREMVFIGFVAIRDPLREDVKDAVAECRAAGIEVKMITGDNVETARAIAHEIGLLDRSDAVVLTHDEFEAMSDDKLKETLPRLRVLARARPLDKLRMVNLLQQQEHVVAMICDGTNDAPALRRADVGLAMGVAGTEVAKEASKIVLLDDAFSTIVKACHWGRSLYENIQRFVQFQLTINVSALTIAFLGPLFDIRPPFTVLMLLWINVIMDTFASIALCSEPPREGLMKIPPKRKNESIVTRQMLISIISTAGFFVVAMMALLVGMRHWGWFGASSGANPDNWDFDPLNVRQVTIFFTVYVLFQVWNQINCRSLTPEQSGLKGLFRNPAFLAIASLTLIGQILIATIGGAVFKVEPLGIMDWIVIAAGTASVLVFSELARLIRKR